MAEEEQAAKPGGKQRFKSTRQLVKIALDEGMTQEEIARLCRTQQSVVSKWSNGKGRGTEEQLAPLLKRFGARLRRTVTRIYLVDDATPPPFEQSPAGVRLRKITERHNACVTRWKDIQTKQRRDAVPDQGLLQDVRILYKALGLPFFQYHPINWQQLDGEIKEQSEVARVSHQRPGQRLVQVEGAIIFRYTFYERDATWHRRNFGVFRIPLARWVLHEQRHDRFLLILQDRRRLFGLDRHLLLREDDRLKNDIKNATTSATERQIVPLAPSNLLESPDDAGRWISRIQGPWTAVQLLQFLNDYLAELETRHTPHDEQVLPFLLRKTLIELGYPVPGLSILSSTDEPDSQS